MSDQTISNLQLLDGVKSITIESCDAVLMTKAAKELRCKEHEITVCSAQHAKDGGVLLFMRTALHTDPTNRNHEVMMYRPQYQTFFRRTLQSDIGEKTFRIDE